MNERNQDTEKTTPIRHALIGFICQLCGVDPAAEMLEPFGMNEADPLKRPTYRCQDKVACQQRQTLAQRLSNHVDSRWDESFEKVEDELHNGHGESSERKAVLRVAASLISFKRNTTPTKFVIEVCIAVVLCETLFSVIGEKGVALGIAFYAFRELFLSLLIELFVGILLKRVFSQ